MAGKRLVDAAKVLQAGRSVAQQHLNLRRQQWNVYSDTSSLAKAVKSQTDRVTVTAGALWELSKRFNESGSAWQHRPQERESGKDTADFQESKKEETVVQSAAKAGVYSDERLQTVSPTPGEDDGTLSSLRKREQQRLAESQIPSASAYRQPVSDPDVGQDVFSQRSDAVSPELSSIPRKKIPRHVDTAQGGGEILSEKDINQEVFYGAEERNGHDDTAQEALDNTIVEGIFSSPRVSHMLSKTGSKSANPYADRPKAPAKPLPEMVAAEEKRRREAQEHGQSEHRVVADEKAVSLNGDAEMQDLAKSMASEVENPTPTTDATAKPDDIPYEMRESRVPSTRFGRLWQYGGLATSMAFGAVGESFRRFGGGGGGNDGSIMLSEANMNRLVAKLSRMRGAALKLGQMMSFQDSNLLPPTINAVLSRVQDSADYMPSAQRNKVLTKNLGDDWRSLFSNFEEKPFAAASIGQVHKATLASNSKEVAVKIQYPGVRNSIDSDLNNLSLLLTASRLLPKGLYLDKTIANARIELGWECDYEREARACERFATLVQDEGMTFAVPEVHSEASGPDVLTADFMTGTAVTKIADLTQRERDWIGSQVLRLSLRELTEWRFMQTDPNWTNFLYNRDSGRLELLDFGASRDFPASFVQPYVALLEAASKRDRSRCRQLSIELGYLTGHESGAMLSAHIDSIFVLAEPFVDSAETPAVYEFEHQTITDRVRANIGLMLRERLAPPPEETYSLHRKLSGAFLLCARLRSRVRAKEMFGAAIAKWKEAGGRENGASV